MAKQRELMKEIDTLRFEMKQLLNDKASNDDENLSLEDALSSDYASVPVKSTE